MQNVAPASPVLAQPIADTTNGAPPTEPSTTDRRARRQRRETAGGSSAESSWRSVSGPELAGRNAAQSPARRARRAARRDNRGLPRAPLAEKSHAAAGEDAETEEPASTVPSLMLPPTELVIADAASRGKRAPRTLQRARRMQEAAADAMDAADDNPALGALNRHLNMLMQQLATAHRVIGRVAAERDALRQQLADLQGIPVEQIKVTSIGAGSEKTSKALVPAEPNNEANRFAAVLSYFSVDDFDLMRKRRLGLAAVILAFVISVWLASTAGKIQLPDITSREDLGRIQVIGNFIPIFLAGWLLYRVVRVSSKGIRWVFPSEDARRRRR